jgi:hypothetical protein
LVVPSILIIELNTNSPWFSVLCTSDEVIVKSIRLCSAYSFFSCAILIALLLKY